MLLKCRTKKKEKEEKFRLILISNLVNIKKCKTREKKEKLTDRLQKCLDYPLLHY